MLTKSISQTIRAMSSVHGTAASIRAGEKTVEQVARKTVFSVEYFPAFLGFTMVTSAVAGYQFMEHLRRQRFLAYEQNA
eukprot:CAMPEP_0113617920 /NCGR_PEP_ID=MMETSP0017_2-20120614/9055_1 /TAXON_ID=2856 /ORGANISM="Cylindrotheca closterium" /LENGTH=78 /DNA_ID=CAMNT_0000527383 /DNA_START=85 /DNA_END=321 /DNA_ORIENTATION=+ /assembly_acc=CAM_ASM_000147